MRRATTLAAAVFLATALPAMADTDPARQAVARHFISSAEPTAKDAAWANDRLFKVGVFNDGTSKDGYAMYVCEFLRERGLAKDTRVQVVDILKLVNRHQWVVLGESRCD